MLTKEMIEEAKWKGDASYDWGNNYYRRSVYDLYLTIGNVGYRVATYSTKTKRVILICPHIHIPSPIAVEHWISYIEKKGEE
jgi:hypothetical protein